jgi:hypothetical protein
MRYSGYVRAAFTDQRGRWMTQASKGACAPQLTTSPTNMPWAQFSPLKRPQKLASASRVLCHTNFTATTWQIRRLCETHLHNEIHTRLMSGAHTSCEAHKHTHTHTHTHTVWGAHMHKRVRRTRTLCDASHSFTSSRGSTSSSSSSLRQQTCRAWACRALDTRPTAS